MSKKVTIFKTFSMTYFGPRASRTAVRHLWILSNLQTNYKKESANPLKSISYKSDLANLLLSRCLSPLYNVNKIWARNMKFFLINEFAKSVLNKMAFNHQDN